MCQEKGCVIARGARFLSGRCGKKSSGIAIGRREACAKCAGNQSLHGGIWEIQITIGEEVPKSQSGYAIDGTGGFQVRSAQNGVFKELSIEGNTI